MVRRILKYGDPILRRPAPPVLDGDPDLPSAIDDLIATVHAAPGVGLAAPQIGVSKRVFVIDLSRGRRADDLILLINPEYVSRDGMQLEEEGCLSVPGFQATVARAASVVVRGHDRTGKRRTVEAEGLLSRALQHEIDHLNGVLFIDRLRRIQRRLIVRRVEALQREGRW